MIQAIVRCAAAFVKVRTGRGLLLVDIDPGTAETTPYLSAVGQDNKDGWGSSYTQAAASTFGSALGSAFSATLKWNILPSLVR